MWKWLFSLTVGWRVKQVERGLEGVEKRMAKWDRDVQIHQRRLEAMAEALVEDIQTVGDELGVLRRNLAEIQQLQRKYETELEAARSRQQVAEDVTIPALVAANKLIQERMDADVAIQIRRQVGASVDGRE